MARASAWGQEVGGVSVHAGHAALSEQFDRTEHLRSTGHAESHGSTVVLVADRFRPWVPAQTGHGGRHVPGPQPAPDAETHGDALTGWPPGAMRFPRGAAEARALTEPAVRTETYGRDRPTGD